MIRYATLEDIDAVYELGCSTRELRVSANALPFMSKEELETTIRNYDAIFLVDDNNQPNAMSNIIGFCLACISDVEKPGALDQACIVYLAVDSDFREDGVGSALYNQTIAELRERGVKYIYAWADQSVVKFLQNRGFAKGKECVWMDRAI